MKSHILRVALPLILLIAALGLFAYSVRSDDASPTPDWPADSMMQNTQHMMAGMQGMMQSYQTTSMPPETWQQMQDMMAAMHGLMNDMESMPHSGNMPEMMQQMQGMMSAMQAMMEQMHPAAPDQP